MSDKVKQDDKKRLERESRTLRGEDWHFGMPIEDDDEDPDGGVFDLAEMMDTMGPFGNRRRALGRLDDQDWDDPFNEDFNMGRFVIGGMFDARPRRQRRPREQPDLGGVRVGPPRTAATRQQEFGRLRVVVPPRVAAVGEQEFGRVRAIPSRANAMRQQEAMFNHGLDEDDLRGINLEPRNRNRPATEQQEAIFNHGLDENDWRGINPEPRNRNRPAAGQTNTGAERLAARPREIIGGAQRLGRTPAAGAARAAALARPRRGA